MVRVGWSRYRVVQKIADQEEVQEWSIASRVAHKKSPLRVVQLVQWSMKCGPERVVREWWPRKCSPRMVAEENAGKRHSSECTF